MSPAPWQEAPNRVVVEFQRSSGRGGRTITLKHSAEAVPYQLQGRLTAEHWASFMHDIVQLARTHPYVVAPSAGRVCEWLGGLAVGAVLGFCCVNPDGGDYESWLGQVTAVLAAHRPALAAAGVSPSLQDAHGSYWVQLDLLQPPPQYAHPAPAPHGTVIGQPVGIGAPPGAAGAVGWPQAGGTAAGQKL